MPPPGKPYIASGAAGLSAREADEVDRDYDFFLDHVRLDGHGYALYIPSKDGVSPPEVIRYEQPLDGSNVGAPVVGPEGGGRGGPPPSEEGPWAARDPPRAAPYGAAHPRAGVKRKAPDATPSAEARSGGVPMEEDAPAPAPQPAWYDSQAGIDEQYRFFLRHLRKVNEREAVLKVGNLRIPFGHEPPADNSYAEEEDDAEEDEDELIPASGQSGEDGAGTDEEEEVFAEKEAGVDLDLQVVNVSDSEVKEEEVSEDEEDDEDSQEEEVDEEDEEWEVEGEDSEVGPGSDLQVVNILDFEIKDEMEEEDELSAPVKGITESQPLNREASSSKGHAAIPRNALELQGVIWPPHITERPNSDFKKKLMQILMKPYKQEEYDRYFSMATNRTPVVKERRTRHSVVYYPWKHELGKSYFDSYPDLAEQFKLQDNNYPNRLALLRGFFFWLENVGREDQFRPWRDDFKRYRVVSFT
ncbi:hypothetical protein SETIT_7G183300v2 [Setaria italica]|uniref:Uncharacterized protein n=1 Tax=Setaria italica TaxID=4555 RepID=A0A368RX22_SETIT|nr:uncharacterized protein LOC101777645 [Setaria italica]RCV34742.1 hypothetical protein SETIT_7G183300v2 [Setaria italica]